MLPFAFQCRFTPRLRLRSASASSVLTTHGQGDRCTQLLRCKVYWAPPTINSDALGRILTPLLLPKGD
jgi:hypothetical protein